MAHRRSSGHREQAALAVPGEVRTLPLRRIFLITGAVAVALIAVLAYRSVKAKNRAASSTVVAKQVVVMPFTNVGGDSTQEYLADGVAAELVNALTNNHALRVSPRVAAAVLKREGKSAQQVGFALHARAVVEGTVRRSGGRVRLTADLINPVDGAKFWSGEVEGDAASLLTLEDQFEQKITGAMDTRLGEKPAPVALKRGTASVAAYDAYLHGKYVMSKRSDATVRRAQSFFQESIAKDSMFSRAYGGLAVAQIFIVQLTPKPDLAQFNAIIASCERSLELDPTDTDGHLAMGYLTVLRGQNGVISDVQGAQSEQHLKRALGREPWRPLAHEWYGELLAKLDRYDEALDQMKLAQSLEPTSPRVASEVADVLFNVRYQAALAENMQSSALDTVLALGFKNYSGALAFLHRSDEMVRAFQKVLTLDPHYPDARGHMVYALAATGKRADAQKLADEVLRDGEAQRASAYEVAVSRMGLGDVDGTLKWINKSIADSEVETGPRRISCDPYFDPLLVDVRYMEVLRKIGARNCPRN